jgi:hypothetical protein
MSRRLGGGHKFELGQQTNQHVLHFM